MDALVSLDRVVLHVLILVDLHIFHDLSEFFLHKQ